MKQARTKIAWANVVTKDGKTIATIETFEFKDGITAVKGRSVPAEEHDALFKPWTITGTLTCQKRLHKHYKKFTHVLCTFFLKIWSLCKSLIIKLKKRT